MNDINEQQNDTYSIFVSTMAKPCETIDIRFTYQSGGNYCYQSKDDMVTKISFNHNSDQIVFLIKTYLHDNANIMQFIPTTDIDAINGQMYIVESELEQYLNCKDFKIIKNHNTSLYVYDMLAIKEHIETIVKSANKKRKTVKIPSEYCRYIAIYDAIEDMGYKFYFYHTSCLIYNPNYQPPKKRKGKNKNKKPKVQSPKYLSRKDLAEIWIKVYDMLNGYFRAVYPVKLTYKEKTSVEIIKFLKQYKMGVYYYEFLVDQTNHSDADKRIMKDMYLAPMKYKYDPNKNL